MYLTFPQMDTMEKEFLEQTRGREIDLVVCSDAEAILGIGDQGVGVRELFHVSISYLICSVGDWSTLMIADSYVFSI